MKSGAKRKISTRSIIVRPAIASLLSFLLCSPSFAQSTVPSQPDQERAIAEALFGTDVSCKTSVLTTYDVRGFWFPGTIRVCPTSFDDLSSGAYAAQTGQRLFYVYGRGNNGNPYAFVRGRTNTPYEFAHPEYGTVGYTSTKPSTFADMVATLPFVPYGIMTYELAGQTRYAYADLHFLPGREAMAYPLNRNSIVFRVDGFFLDSPDALMGMFAYAKDEKYLEVEYVQNGENPQIARSAFLPVLSTGEVGSNWRSLVASSPIANVGSSNRLVTLLEVGFAITALWYAAEATGVGDMWRDQQEKCHRMQRASAVNLFC